MHNFVNTISLIIENLIQINYTDSIQGTLQSITIILMRKANHEFTGMFGQYFA